VEPAIQRAAMRSVIAGYECKGLRAGQAPLFDWRVREGIEQHVDSAANEGVSVELLHHIAPHLKMSSNCSRLKRLGGLWSQSTTGLSSGGPTGQSFVGISSWTMQVAPSMVVVVSIAAMLVLGSILGIRDHVEEGLWWNLNWFLRDFLLHEGHWRRSRLLDLLHPSYR
jgi:hypothetical protein